MMATIVSLLIALVILALFFFTRQKDIIETHETNIRILGGLVVAGIWIICCVLMGLVTFEIASSHLNSNHAAGRLSLLILFSLLVFVGFLPILFAVFSYLNIDRFYARKFKLVTKQRMSLNQRRVLGMVRRLSKLIKIKKPPKVLFSAYENIPPATFGGGSANMNMVLPANFSQIISEATELAGHREATTSLAEFVLLHELSHIKNGDVLFLSWASCFLSSFKLWLLPYCTLTVILMFWMEVIPWVAPLIARNVFFLAFSCVNFGAFYLLILSVSRQREFLADARASVFLKTVELGLLTGSRLNSRVRSVLKTLLSYITRLALATDLYTQMRMGSRLRILPKVVSFSGTGDSKTWRKGFLGWLFATHPSANERVEALSHQKYVGTLNYVPSFGSSAWIGVVAILLYIGGPLFLGTCSYGRTSSITDEINNYLTAAAVLFMALSFSLPFRNAFNYLPQLGTYIWHVFIKYLSCTIFMIFTNLILTFITVAIALAMTEPSGAGDFFRFTLTYSLLLSGCGALVSFLFAMAIGTGLILEKIDKGFIIIAVSFLTPCLLILVGTKVLFFPEISLLSILTWFVVAAAAFGFLLLTNAFTAETRRSYSSSALFGKHEFPTKLSSRKFFWHVVVGFGTFAVGLLPIMLIIGIILFLFPVHRNLSLETSLFLIVPTFVAFSIVQLRELGSGITQSAQLLPQLLGFARVANIAGVTSDSPRNAAVAFTNRLRAKDSAYRGTTTAVNMETTFACVLPVKLLGGNCGDENTIVGWVLACQNNEGGFGVWPGATPTLVNTQKALCTLKLLGGTTQLDKEKHVNWLVSKCSAITSGSGGRPVLEKLYLALDSLDMLGIERPCVSEISLAEIKAYCQDGEKSCKDMFRLVRCLEILGSLTRNMKQKLCDQWVRPRAALFAVLRPDKNIEDISYYLRVVHILNGRDKDATHSQMSKTFDNVLRSFKNILVLQRARKNR